MERKDKIGKNTVEILKYYTDFYTFSLKGYLNCNIHEKITIRSAYCGNTYPSLIIMEIVRDI